ncbi:MAG: SMP-30/gluconolactonase/LRE family protein [Streptosporangiaceae bacterium]
MTRAVQVTEVCSEHGEGPVWWAGWPGLRWVDMLAGDLLTLGADGSVARRHLGTVLAALRPRSGGGMVIALECGFALVDEDWSVRSLGDLWADPGVRMNDGGCDPDGRFYCGSMAYASGPGRGSLYRLDTGGSSRVVLGGVTVSNGLAWSPDGSTAYYVDSATRRVDAFDYDPERGLSGRRPAVKVDPPAGIPDGLTVDDEGHLWVALHGGGAVHRYRADGRLDGRVEVPVSQVTACTFGGPRLDQLYITTSRLDRGPAAEPGAGALFRADVGITGLPAAAFGG